MNAWFAILLALQLGDVLTTLYAMKRGATEQNRQVIRAMNKWGVEEALLAGKVSFIAIVSTAMEFGLLPLLALQVLCVGYAALLLWNLYQIARLP